MRLTTRAKAFIAATHQVRRHRAIYRKRMGRNRLDVASTDPSNYPSEPLDHERGSSSLAHQHRRADVRGEIRRGIG